MALTNDTIALPLKAKPATISVDWTKARLTILPLKHWVKPGFQRVEK